MKRLLLAALLILFTFSVVFAVTKFEYYPQNIEVKSLLKSPESNSDDTFVFPIDVTLTGVSKDKKWYRIKVYYDLVFFGKYEFEGWCKLDPWKSFTTNATPEVIELK